VLKEEIEEHQNIYRYLQRENEEAIRRTRETELKMNREANQRLNYQPKLSLDADRYSKQTRMQEELEQQRERAEKVDSYSKFVKQMYWPKVSAKKQHELEILKQNIAMNRQI